MPTKSISKSRSKTPIHIQNFRTYVPRLAKRADASLSLHAVAVLSKMAQHTMETLLRDSDAVRSVARAKTLKAKHAAAATVLSMPLLLGQDCVDAGEAAVRCYDTSKVSRKKADPSAS